MKGNYQHIIEIIEGEVGRISLHRPEVHNAMHIEMIRELTIALQKLNSLEDVRLIIFDSTGDNFSAGADLHWMKNGMKQSKQQLSSESKELALLFNEIYNSRKPTLAVAKGKVLGGANGIIAAADIALAGEETSFAFTEVRLGLIPATIAPYIFRKVGESVTREWMLTGRPIDANEALHRGLLHFVWPSDKIEENVNSLVQRILANGPKAMKGVKDLFRKGSLNKSPDELIDSTADLIAFYRTSEEGQEGINSFFEKRKPDWK